MAALRGAAFLTERSERRFPDLTEIGNTRCLSAAGAGGIERRQQYRRQNGDDGDDDQKFDKCKAFFHIVKSP